jgi:hypothetical protein
MAPILIVVLARDPWGGWVAPSATCRTQTASPGRTFTSWPEYRAGSSQAPRLAGLSGCRRTSGSPACTRPDGVSRRSNIVTPPCFSNSAHPPVLLKPAIPALQLPISSRAVTSSGRGLILDYDRAIAWRLHSLSCDDSPPVCRRPCSRSSMNTPLRNVHEMHPSSSSNPPFWRWR